MNRKHSEKRKIYRRYFWIETMSSLYVYRPEPNARNEKQLLNFPLKKNSRFGISVCFPILSPKFLSFSRSQRPKKCYELCHIHLFIKSIKWFICDENYKLPFEFQRWRFFALERNISEKFMFRRNRSRKYIERNEKVGYFKILVSVKTIENECESEKNGFHLNRFIL